MKKNYFFSTDHWVIVAGTPFIILVLCLYYIHVVYTGNILPAQQVNYFQPTYCFLLEKKMSTQTDAHEKLFYRSDFYVSYRVDGVQFSRWVSGNGLDLSYSKNQNIENALLSQFNRGQNYLCWYDPNNPKRVALVVKHHPTIIFSLYIPLIIFILLSYMMLKKYCTYLGRAKKGVALVTGNRNK